LDDRRLPKANKHTSGARAAFSYAKHCEGLLRQTKGLRVQGTMAHGAVGRQRLRNNAMGIGKVLRKFQCRSKHAPFI